MAITNTLISTLTTKTGTTVTKSLRNYNGVKTLVKNIEYAPNSRIAKNLGIGKVIIEKAKVGDKSKDLIQVYGSGNFKNYRMYVGERIQNIVSHSHENLTEFFKKLMNAK